MSRTRNYRQDTLDVQRRFFEALHALADARRIPGGLSGYCVSYGLDRRHLYTQERNPGRGYFEVAWIVPLVRYYGVSSGWLLTGAGGMFRGKGGASSAALRKGAPKDAAADVSKTGKEVVSKTENTTSGDAAIPSPALEKEQTTSEPD